jgi:hypothetical protein
MRLEILLAVVVLLVAAALLRMQFRSALGEVTNPDSNATPIIPVATPITKPLCGRRTTARTACGCRR